ncbi:MAG: hypothetical protein ACHQT8_03915 [Chlamydiales bacterium]
MSGITSLSLAPNETGEMMRPRVAAYVPARIVREAKETLEGFQTVATYSASTYFAIQATHYRNCVGVEDPDWVERIGRRVVGELCYYALIVVSLVEAAARLISIPFCLVTLPLIYYFNSWNDCVSESKLRVRYSLVGALLSISNAASCAIALLRNPPERTLRYENLFPPTSASWDFFVHDVFRSSVERNQVDYGTAYPRLQRDEYFTEYRPPERDEWKAAPPTNNSGL